MNKKGEMGIGIIILTFITVIVGIILFQAIAQQVGSSTSLDTLANLSLGVQNNGTTYYLETYKHISNPVIYGNGSNPVLLSSGNYTLTNNVINPTTGALSVSILPSSEYTGTVWNISGTGQPVTYIADGGARAVSGLIAIFFALAVLMVAMIPTLREGFLSKIGR